MSAISVVVCTYRRQALLPDLFAALRAQTRPADEILIVDNEVSDATAALVRAAAGGLPIRYVSESTLGLSHARNRGAAESQGDLIVFLDDDALPEPGWVAALVSGAERHPEAGIFGGPIRLLLEAAPPPWFPAEVMPFVHWLGHNDFGPVDKAMVPEGNRYCGPGGGNLALRREVLQAVGPFATALGRRGESLISGEEVLLVERARKLGHQVWYLAGAGVQHLVPATRLDRIWFVRRSFSEGRSQARIMESLSDAVAERAALQQQLRDRVQAVGDLSARLARTGLCFGQLSFKAQIDFAMVLGLVVELAAVLGQSRAQLNLPAELPDDPALPDEWRRFCGPVAARG
jgi:GT2 family glycosyltransferase